MKLIEKPVEDEAHIFTGNIEPQFPGGKWVYEAKELKIGYDGRALLELSLRIRRGQKIAVIGDNGIGKSTFLKTVAGLIPPIIHMSNAALFWAAFPKISAAICWWDILTSSRHL